MHFLTGINYFGIKAADDSVPVISLFNNPITNFQVDEKGQFGVCKNYSSKIFPLILQFFYTCLQ